MRQLQNQEYVLDEADLIDLIYRDPGRKIRKLYTEPGIVNNNDLDLESYPRILSIPLDTDINNYDQHCQATWLMPPQYHNLDIARLAIDLCKTETERQRVAQELIMFQERDMFPLLRYLKYLVDTMSLNGIVWGVGRGSSVASYVLYLLGVHKINSIYYDLDINEFLKPLKNVS